MITARALYEAALAVTGRPIAEGDAALAFVNIDQDALRAAQAERVRWERWDGESNIGGAAPADIAGRADYGGGEVYLIYVDDELTYLQPHAPGSLDNAPIAAEDLAAIAEEHCATVVDDLVFQAALRALLLALPAEVQVPLPPAPPPAPAPPAPPAPPDLPTSVQGPLGLQFRIRDRA